MDRAAPRLDSRDRAASAEAARRMGTSRGGHRLVEDHAASRLSGAPAEMGRRAHLLLVRAEPAIEQGLRAADGDRRSDHLHRDDTTDAEAIDPKALNHFQTVSQNCCKGL